MDTDSFVLSFNECNVNDKYTVLSNLDTPIKINNNVPRKFKHKLGSKAIEEFIVLKLKTYSLKNGTSKAKGKKERKQWQT